MASYTRSWPLLSHPQTMEPGSSQTAERVPFDPDAAVRISATFVKALAEVVDAERFGPELHDVVCDARRWR